MPRKPRIRRTIEERIAEARAKAISDEGLDERDHEEEASRVHVARRDLSRRKERLNP